MFNPILKKSISMASLIAVLLIGWYGTYLPLRKSILFINAESKLGQVTSLADFEKTMSTPLDVFSPIGQEELVRNTANTILATIQQYGQNVDLTKALVIYTSNYYQPILIRGRGMSFEQDLFLMGIINEAAFLKTGDNQYLVAAQKYFEEGRQLGPKRPQNLYGLFDIYRAEGNVEKVKEVGGQILSQWPSDIQIQTALPQFLNGTSQK